MNEYANRPSTSNDSKPNTGNRLKMHLVNELHAAANTERDIYKKILFRRAAAMIHNLSRPARSQEDKEMPEIRATSGDRL
jgi:hypothetical protein